MKIFLICNISAVINDCLLFFSTALFLMLYIKRKAKNFIVTATHGQFIIERVVYGSRNCQLTIVTAWLIYPLWSFQSTYGLV